MRRPTDRLAGLLIPLLVPATAAAGAQLQDVKGSKDHPVVSRYAGSTVIGYQVRDFDEFELPLGPVQRVEGAGIVVEPTKSQRLEGRHTRILYVAPAERSPLEVLYVVGHTDDVGGFDYNTRLSQRRAASVVRALTAEHGIAAARLQPAGVGLLAPVAPNDTEEGRAKNRRVELVEQ